MPFLTHKNEITGQLWGMMEKRLKQAHKAWLNLYQISVSKIIQSNTHTHKPTCIYT